MNERESLVYRPHEAGSQAVQEHEFLAVDGARRPTFPCTLWLPRDRHDALLIGYSHFSGGNRRAATFLCEHLASHGYAVAALDHSEVVAPELARREGEDDAARAARVAGWISNRVPDMQVLIDGAFDEAARCGVRCDRDSVGLAGHSFGGWTVLATPDIDERVAAVVALVPAGGRPPPAGTIPVEVPFGWRRAVATLIVAAAEDQTMPPSVVAELYARAPQPKRFVMLPRADHLHFVDDVESKHEAFRAMTFKGAIGDIVARMKPIGALMPGAEAQRRIRALVLAHFDATLRASSDAQAFLATRSLRVAPCDFTDPRVLQLLALHVARARAQTPAGSAHALDADGLQTAGATAWCAWEDDTLLGIGALKHLSAEHGEIKSMHTVESARGRGVGSALLAHIIDNARAYGLRRLSLETGSSDYFAPARRLYARHGFVPCAPFGAYLPDRNSVFMTRELGAGDQSSQ